MYGGPPGIGFGTGLDRAEPVFNSGGYVAGVMAAEPPTHGVHVEVHADGSPRLDAFRSQGAPALYVRLADARNCEGYRRFVLAWPLLAISSSITSRALRALAS